MVTPVFSSRSKSLVGSQHNNSVDGFQAPDGPIMPLGAFVQAPIEPAVMLQGNFRCVYICSRCELALPQFAKGMR